MRTFALINFALVAIAACGRREEATVGDLGAGDRVPQGWILEEMVRSALTPDVRLAPGRVERNACVLIWSIDEDARPLRVLRSCLWIHAIDSHQRQSWVLACLGRHPQFDRGWIVNDDIADPPDSSTAICEGRQIFDAPPSVDDFLAFLRRNTWDWSTGIARDQGFKPVDSGICESACRRTLGGEVVLPKGGGR